MFNDAGEVIPAKTGAMRSTASSNAIKEAFETAANASAAIVSLKSVPIAQVLGAAKTSGCTRSDDVCAILCGHFDIGCMSGASSKVDVRLTLGSCGEYA